MALLVVSTVVGNGCQKGAEKTPEAEQVSASEVEAQAEEVTAKVPGKMSDDLWVELMAHRHYLADKYAAHARTDSAGAAAAMAREWQAACSTLGVSQEDWEAWADSLPEDAEEYTALIKRASERVEELKARDQQ